MKVRLFIACVLLGAIYLSCTGTTSDIRIGSAFDESKPLTSNDINQAIDKGILFLINTQNNDGSWGTFESARPGEVYLGTVASHDAFRNASTALCCMALMEVPPGRDDKIRRMALNKGIRYLMKQQPEGRACGDALYHIWALTYVSQCLSRSIKYEYLDLSKDEIITCARKWLLMLQHMQAADGGWCYYDFGYKLRKPSGWQSTSFNTSASLCALWEAEKAGLEIDPKVKKSALKCLEKLRTPEKGFFYANYCQMFPEWSPNRTKGSLGRSQPGNLMLFRYGKIPVADLKFGLDQMFQEHHFMEMGMNRPYPHESWYATSGYYFFFGHFYASAVIKELPLDEQFPYWKALVRVLVTCQQKDGSWWDFPMYGYHKAYGTAFAILALLPTIGGFNK